MAGKDPGLFQRMLAEIGAYARFCAGNQFG
jgi:hypothetical protein